MDLPNSLVRHAPWQSQSNPIWLASAFELSRNFNRYKFPAKMDETEKQSLRLLQKKFIMGISSLKDPLWVPASELTSLSKEFLFEHFLCLESFQGPQDDQSFIIDTSSEVFIILNGSDHLRIRFFDSSGKWENGFSKLSEIESAIGKEVEYAFSSKFGYLTADPMQCGTALKIYAYLHLPALIHMHQLENALSKEKEEGVIASSMVGNINQLVGDIIVLENYYTLGVTEDSILRILHITGMKLIGAEKTLRMHIKQNKSPEIMDHVARAYGLLRHSYQLGTKEALDALSFVKLGIDLGWIDGVTETKANELFFMSRRAHLATTLNEKQFDQPEMAQKRAHFLHEELSNMKLLIEI